VSSTENDMPELVTAYIDGELSEPEAKAVAERIEADPAVKRFAAAQRATKRLVATRTPRHTAPTALRQNIRAAVFGEPRARQARPAGERPSLWWLLTHSPTAASVAGAGLLVAVLAVVLVLSRSEPITPYIDDVYAHHTQVDRFPVRIEGSYEVVAAETSEALGFRVPVPRLGDEFSLRGARKCSLCGHVMAYVKYQGDQGLVSFFVIALEKHTRDGMIFYTASHKGLQMAFWRRGGMTYCVAAPLPEDDVVALACTACEQAATVRTAITAATPVLIARLHVPSAQ
jgi:anti-sigma factor RsiW